MGLFVAILFLPALVLWLVAAVDFMRSAQHVRHDQGFGARVNPLIWLSKWRRDATFDETGQRLVARAQTARRWFLRYCVFLVIVLIGIRLIWPPVLA